MPGGPPAAPTGNESTASRNARRQPDGRRPTKDRRLLALGMVEEVHAELLDPQGLGHRRHDEREAGRRLDLGQLVDEAAQAVQLPASGRVGLDPRDHGDHVVGMDLERRHLGDDAALAEDRDAVDEPEDLVEAVGHEQHGRTGDCGAPPATARRSASRSHPTRRSARRARAPPGDGATALAMATSWRWPPESVPDRLMRARRW